VELRQNAGFTGPALERWRKPEHLCALAPAQPLVRRAVEHQYLFRRVWHCKRNFRHRLAFRPDGSVIEASCFAEHFAIKSSAADKRYERGA
jgi:hypothetical protein